MKRAPGENEMGRHKNKRNPEGFRTDSLLSRPRRSGCRGCPFDEAGLEALRAHADLEGGAVARIDPDALKIDQPTTTRVPIGMADRVPRRGTASATLTDLCHCSFPPFFLRLERGWAPCPLLAERSLHIFASGFYHIFFKRKNVRGLDLRNPNEEGVDGLEPVSARRR